MMYTPHARPRVTVLLYVSAGNYFPPVVACVCRARRTKVSGVSFKQGLCTGRDTKEPTTSFMMQRTAAPQVPV